MHPSLKIDQNGEVAEIDKGARALFAKAPGVYRTLRAGSLMVLALDEGTGAAPRGGEVLAFAGDLSAMSLLGLLNILGQGNETGRLVIKRDQVERVVMIRKGNVASVGSNAMHDRLGRFLVRLGRVTEAELDDAVREAEGTGRRIGQVLLSRGLLDAHELWATIQAQITEIFADVVGWEDGSFVLFRVPEGHRFPSTPPLSMQGLLLEAVRRADEMSVFRRKIKDRNVVFFPTDKAPSELDENEASLLECIDGTRSLFDLGQALHLSEFDVTSLAHRLLTKRLITSETGAAPLSPASAPALSTDDSARIEVYNLAFREIRDEVVRNGKLDPFLIGLSKYMHDPAGPHEEIFRGVEFGVSGALPTVHLIHNAESMGVEDLYSVLSEALNDLTFFMLFQCGELLDAASDENLARRVRLIHAALEN